MVNIHEQNNVWAHGFQRAQHRQNVVGLSLYQVPYQQAGAIAGQFGVERGETDGFCWGRAEDQAG